MIQLSIIIPVYNVEKYIQFCIESIFRQGLDETSYEIIIVNDGTRDDSMKVIEEFYSQHHNIIVIEQENQGSWVARNTGMTKASGEYILFADPDDLLIDDSLQPLLAKALETKADIVVADYLEMNDKEINEINRNPPRQKDFTIQKKTGELLLLEDLNPYHCYIWRSLFRKAFLEDNHLTFNTEFFYQDVPFLHECYIKANRCLRISWLLNIYRRGHESATFSFSYKKAKNLCTAIAKTWELIRIDSLSPQEQDKLREDVYTSFSAIIWILTHKIDASDRTRIIDFLRQQAPDLRFSHGKKQKLESFMYRHMPHMYIHFSYIYDNYFNNNIHPTTYHR